MPCHETVYLHVCSIKLRTPIFSVTDSSKEILLVKFITVIRPNILCAYEWPPSWKFKYIFRLKSNFRHFFDLGSRNLVLTVSVPGHRLYWPIIRDVFIYFWSFEINICPKGNVAHLRAILIYGDFLNAQGQLTPQSVVQYCVCPFYMQVQKKKFGSIATEKKWKHQFFRH